FRAAGIAQRGNEDPFGADRALQQSRLQQHVHYGLGVVVERRVRNVVRLAQVEQDVLGRDATLDIAVGGQRDLDVRMSAGGPHTITVARDELREIVHRRAAVQQLVRTVAIREQVGGLLVQQGLQLRVEERMKGVAVGGEEIG